MEDAMYWMIFALLAVGNPQRPMSEMHGDCGDFAMDLQAEFAAWKAAPKPLSANTEPKGSTSLAADEVILVSLPLMKKVSFPDPPAAGRTGFIGVHGGLVRVRVAEKGVYRFCLGSKTWIDVVDLAGKQAIKPKQFEMQTQCTQIFKVVTYELEANTDYWLQIAYCPNNEVRILLSRES